MYVFAQPVTADQAEGLARNLFGSAGIEVSQVNGHQVFLNGCVRGIPGDACLSAAAVSMAPDFVVITWDGASEEELQRLAQAVASGTAG